jgi:hypothetical protein
LRVNFERPAQIIRVSLKRPGEEQQGREFRTQRSRISVPTLRRRHTLAESSELTAQLLVFRLWKAWMFICRRRLTAGER